MHLWLKAGTRKSRGMGLYRQQFLLKREWGNMSYKGNYMTFFGQCREGSENRRAIAL